MRKCVPLSLVALRVGRAVPKGRMNAKLVTLALGCATWLPGTVHAQIANVTVYGSLNLDLELVRGQQSDGTNPTVTRVSSNSSRLGVRGSEYLGRGQVAIFQIESTIQGDTGNSPGSGSNSASSGLASRESFVGLQGDWGTLKAGKFLTPYDDILPIFGNTPTLTTSILSTAAVWAQGPLSKQLGGFDARLGNSLRYETPPLDGFSAELQYSTRDSSGNANRGDNGDHSSEVRHANVVSLGAFYSSGPIDLGIAYEHNYQVRTIGQNDSALSIAAAYDVGSLFGNPGLRIGGVYERLNYGTLAGSLTRNFWAASLTVPAGGGSFYAFWGRAGNGGGSAPDGTGVGALTKGPDTGCTQWEISYSYALSLRTLLYAGYVRLDNGANCRTTFSIAITPPRSARSPPHHWASRTSSEEPRSSRGLPRCAARHARNARRAARIEGTRSARCIRRPRSPASTRRTTSRGTQEGCRGIVCGRLPETDDQSSAQARGTARTARSRRRASTASSRSSSDATGSAARSTPADGARRSRTGRDTPSGP